MAETLREIEVPQCDVGAPLPHIIAAEGGFVAIYFVERKDRSADTQVAVLLVDSCVSLQFGQPNDEAISGHRLHPLGLGPYAAYEVLNSSLIEALEKANRVHWRHDPAHYSDYRHFIFTFHDSTLEFVAREFAVELDNRPLPDVLAEKASSIAF